MEICGFQRIGLIDYPGKVATILFVSGCNMRCPFCYNSDLVFRNYQKLHIYPEEEVFEKLRESSKFIEGVVISGGEPTGQGDLKEFIVRCREMGLLVKLDTNGTNPGKLKELLDGKLVDYVAIDIKAEIDAEKYKKAMGVQSDPFFSKIRESMDMLLKSGIDYEFRTTAVPGLVTPEGLVNIAREIRGAKAYYIQQFVPGNNLDPEYAKIIPYDPEELQDSCRKIMKEGLVGKCEVRGL
jgi:pyruvate formate lyase activating enzyme